MTATPPFEVIQEWAEDPLRRVWPVRHWLTNEYIATFATQVEAQTACDDLNSRQEEAQEHLVAVTLGKVSTGLTSDDPLPYPLVNGGWYLAITDHEIGLRRLRAKWVDDGADTLGPTGGCYYLYTPHPIHDAQGLPYRESYVYNAFQGVAYCHDVNEPLPTLAYCQLVLLSDSLTTAQE